MATTFKSALETAEKLKTEINELKISSEKSIEVPKEEPKEESKIGPGWGMWDDNGSGNFVWNPTELKAIEKQYGKTVELVHYGDGLNPSASNMINAGKNGGTPFLDWGQNINTTSLLNGKYNTNFAAIQKSATEYGKEILFRPLWEMNGNWYTWGQQANFAEAWRYMHSKITAPNIKWVWCPNYRFKSGGAVNPKPYYPGHEFVDYVGADIYMENWNAKVASELIFSDLKEIAPSKQIIIGEWGVSLKLNSNRPATIKEFFNLLPSNVAGQAYFNWNEGGAGDWRLTDTASIEAYKEGI